MTFFSSVMLWMLYKWFKKKQLEDVRKKSQIKYSDLIFNCVFFLKPKRNIIKKSIDTQVTDKDIVSIKILYGSVTGKAKVTIYFGFFLTMLDSLIIN